MIWESFLDKTIDSEVLKQNISTPQFARLERRAETRADEVRVKTEKQLKIAANTNIEAEKAPHAEEIKVILLKTKKDAEEVIAKFKLEAEQAKAILKKQKEAAKQVKILQKKIFWISKSLGFQNKQLETEPWNVLR